VKAYLSFFRARFRALLQYRGAAIGGMVTQFFFGLVIMMVYQAFYSGADASQPLSLRQVISYVWLGQAFLGMLPWNVEGEQRAMIRSGAVAYELLRPVRLYSLWFARSVAWRTAPTLLRCIPILAFAYAFCGLMLPPSLAAAAAWAAAMAGAVILSAAMTTLVTVSLIWTVTGDGVAQLIFAMSILLSGMNIPLPLFPGWIRPVVEALPFRGLVDTPYRLYVGYAEPREAFGLILNQLGWAAAIVGAGVLLLRRGLRRLSVLGG
jgi:ABC-2 type transport system permease protein